MAIALLLCRLLLAFVFLTAGLAKLADLTGSKKAIQEFGIPEVFARTIGIILPGVEILIAIALISQNWIWYGALAALGLLLIFIAGISYNLARGRRPDCHCFGQIYSAPAGPSTLMRNIFLALIATFIAWSGRNNPQLSATGWFISLTLMQKLSLLGTFIALILIYCESWLLLHLLKQQGRLLLHFERIEKRLAREGIIVETDSQEVRRGLPVGIKAPEFSGVDLNNKEISLETLLKSDKPTVLVFTSSTCAPCQALVPDIGRWQRKYANKLTIVMLTTDADQNNQAKIAEHQIAPVILQRNGEIDRLYNIQATPSAILINSDGLIASGCVEGAKDILALINSVVKRRPLPIIAQGTDRREEPEPIELAIGVAAPVFSLYDLQGKTVSLNSFFGYPTLLLFWNPECPFCQNMLPDLKAWEANPPQGAPALLIIADGTARECRAMGLKSPVLLSGGTDIQLQFGATGTPMAMLVDEQGRIASKLAKGGPEVLALASHTSNTMPSTPL